MRKALFVCAGLFVAVSFAHAGAFRLLGFTQTKFFPQSNAAAVSPLGDYIVGGSNGLTNQFEAFEWTEQHGMVSLGQDTVGANCVVEGGAACGTMKDGSGFYLFGQIGAGVNLPSSTSTDGRIIAGVSWSAGTQHPFAFLALNKVLQPLPLLAGFTQGQALGISAKGSVIVGDCFKTGAEVPVYWDSNGVHTIPLLSGKDRGRAVLVRSDGLLIYGFEFNSKVPNSGLGFVFDGKTMSTFTGPGGSSVTSLDCGAGDGSVLVGEFNSNTAGGQFAITPSAGPVEIRKYLADNGVVPPSGSVIQQVNGVNSDGTIFVGGVSNSSTITLEAFEGITNGHDPLLTTLEIDPLSIVGGNAATGFVGFNSPVTKDETVTFSTSDPVVSVPTSLVIHKGESSAVIALPTVGVASTVKDVQIAAINGTLLRGSRIQRMTVQPAAILALSVVPASVVGGSKMTGVVKLNGKTPPTGAGFTATTDIPAAITVPASVSFAANANSQAFHISTHGVAASTKGTIGVTFRGVSKSYSVTVKPATLLSIVAAAATVKGGQNVRLTLSLTGFAPPSGAKVTLSSSNAAVGVVPSSATVGFDTSSKIVNLSTRAVTGNTTVTITATYGGRSAAVTVTITP